MSTQKKLNEDKLFSPEKKGGKRGGGLYPKPKPEPTPSPGKKIPLRD